MSELEPQGATPAAHEPEIPRYARLPLLGALIKFNVKLVLDSLFDFALAPISIVAVIVGFIRGGDEPDKYFRALMAFGRRTERGINLFDNRGAGVVDDALGAYEQRVADEFARRGWSDKAEAALRKADLSTREDRPPPPPGPPA